jgi:hypothetical protein
VCGAVFLPVKVEAYAADVSRATPTKPSKPIFRRLARNRSLRASVMWINSLVKILRPIADYGRYRNPLSRKVAEMSAVRNRLERTQPVEVHHLRTSTIVDFTSMAAGFGAGLGDDHVDAGGGVPQRVLAGHGQDGHHDVMGGGHVRAKTR